MLQHQSVPVQSYTTAGTRHDLVQISISMQAAMTVDTRFTGSTT